MNDQDLKALDLVLDAAVYQWAQGIAVSGDLREAIEHLDTYMREQRRKQWRSSVSRSHV